MKKMNVKLLATALSTATMFTNTPVHGLVNSRNDYVQVQNQGGKVPLTAKIVTGVGGGVVLGTLIGCIVVASRSKDSDGMEVDRGQNNVGVCDTNVSTSVVASQVREPLPNANLTNTACLCFWHAFIQQLYEIKSFREFVKNMNLLQKTVETSQHMMKAKFVKGNQSKEFTLRKCTWKKIKALRGLFKLMDEGKDLNMAQCRAFAKQLLPPHVIGGHQEISEVWNNYISDVVAVYGEIYGNPIYDQGALTGYHTNILKDPVKFPDPGKTVKLSDLLKENSPSQDCRTITLADLWKNRDNRLAMLRRLPVSSFLDADLDISGNFKLSYTNLLNVKRPDGLYVGNFWELPRSFQTNIFNDFESDPVLPRVLTNQDNWQRIVKDWDSTDPGKKIGARMSVFANLPIGDFLQENAAKDGGLSDGYHLDAVKLANVLNGNNNIAEVEQLLRAATKYKTPFIKTAFNALDCPDLDINVVDDQFSIFVSRYQGDYATTPLSKDTRDVDFGDGTVDYNGQKFELTAISIHHGEFKFGQTGSPRNAGHYYTYKKQNGEWRKYDDADHVGSGRVAWDAVKADAKTNCTMLTFSLKK